GYRAREASERKLRRFVADASHELRTPLAAVRAYAELFHRGAAERPADLERSMTGIGRESERMSVLVEDLLLLARLDEGRPLARERRRRARALDRRRRRRGARRARRRGVGAGGRCDVPHRAAGHFLVRSHAAHRETPAGRGSLRHMVYLSYMLSELRRRKGRT